MRAWWTKDAREKGEFGSWEKEQSQKRFARSFHGRKALMLVSGKIQFSRSMGAKPICSWLRAFDETRCQCIHTREKNARPNDAFSINNRITFGSEANSYIDLNRRRTPLSLGRERRECFSCSFLLFSLKLSRTSLSWNSKTTHVQFAWSKKIYLRNRTRNATSHAILN